MSESNGKFNKRMIVSIKPDVVDVLDDHYHYLHHRYYHPGEVLPHHEYGYPSDSFVESDVVEYDNKHADENLHFHRQLIHQQSIGMKYDHLEKMSNMHASIYV